MIVTTTDIRNDFRIETAVPDRIIQKELDAIDAYFTQYFGNAYTVPSADPSSHPVEVKWLTMAIKELTVALLFRDNYVITGFGVVRKKDEFSENVYNEDVTLFARQCVKAADLALRQLDIPQRTISSLLLEIQPFNEGFFAQRDDKTLGRFNPYWYDRFYVTH